MEDIKDKLQNVVTKEQFSQEMEEMRKINHSLVEALKKMTLANGGR